MIEFSEETFSSLDATSRLLFIADLCHTIEACWKDASKRGQHLKTLKRTLSWIKQHHSEELKYVSRLIPLLDKKPDFQEFFSVIQPVERYLLKHKSSEIIIHSRDKQHTPASPIPLIVVLDNLRSAFNVGSIFRTSEAVGVKSIHLCGYTATPENSKTKKAAMGTEKNIPWFWHGRTKAVIEQLRDEHHQLVALETAENARDLFDYPFPRPSALVLGNERFGLSEEVLKACDTIVRIPVYGLKNSLNVANAYSICAYEIRRQWQGKS